MSHTMTIKTRVVDTEAIGAACRRLGLPQPRHGLHELFDGSKALGTAVRLPGWRYPCVFDIASGEARFDTYGGKWGDERELHKFFQAYAVEKVKYDAAARGMIVSETTLPTGSVELTLAEA